MPLRMQFPYLGVGGSVRRHGAFGGADVSADLSLSCQRLYQVQITPVQRR